jgi:perosamine synthetase
MSTIHEPGALTRVDHIPLAVPEIRGNEWQYVKECLDTSWVSSVGAFVDRFEGAVAAYVGTRQAVACVNGTAALHLALLAAGVEPGDEVLVSALSFIAPANAIRYVDAWPSFIDAEDRYWQMDPNAVRDFLEKQCRWVDGRLQNKNTGRRVRAILPVHILGHPVDIDPLLELAEKYQLCVIEDATESLGACYHDRKVGNLGHIACFSFNGNKIITTGGGGMITTNNEAWAKKAKYLTTQAKDDPIEFVHGRVGYNFRLPNVLAAIGVAQMEVLDEYVSIKRKIAQRYNQAFATNPSIACMSEAPGVFSTYWLYTILIDETSGHSSRTVLHDLDRQRIQARPLWQPLHRSPAYASWSRAQCPTAERLNRQALSLPCSVGLTPEQQETVIEAVLRLLAAD